MSPKPCAFSKLPDKGKTMGTVVTLRQDPNRPIEQRLYARSMVACTLRTYALSEAYLHVLEYHPESQTLQDRFALAVEIAKWALFKAGKSLIENPPFIVSELRPPPS